MLLFQCKFNIKIIFYILFQASEQIKQSDCHFLLLLMFYSRGTAFLKIEILFSPLYIRKALKQIKK